MDGVKKVSMKCTICNHPDRREIDEQIVAGTPVRDIAGRFGISKSAVYRHKKNHLPSSLAKARESEEVAQADDLLGRIRGLQQRSLRILNTAEQSGELKTALKAIRETRENIKLLAQLELELWNRQVGGASNEIVIIDDIAGRVFADPASREAARELWRRAIRSGK